MSKRAIVWASIICYGGLVGCTKKDSTQDRVSYSIGQQVAHSLKAQNVEINLDEFMAGLKDGLKGNKQKYTSEQLGEAMQTMRESLQKKEKDKAEKNAADGKAWLEANAKKPGVKVTASGLQYEIIKQGTGAKPKATDRVRVNYLGTLTNGEKFDSSYDRGQPADLPANQVIPGWTEALQLMPVGSKYKLYIPPQLAYGSSNRPGIPANSTLVFEVELIDILHEKMDSKKKTL